MFGCVLHIRIVTGWRLCLVVAVLDQQAVCLASSKEPCYLKHRKCSHQLCCPACCLLSLAPQVMLGASAVLSNGTVLSRAGSAAVAMSAHASSKPVLVCCEAFKVGDDRTASHICVTVCGL